MKGKFALSPCCMSELKLIKDTKDLLKCVSCEGFFEYIQSSDTIKSINPEDYDLLESLR